ncbi:MAG TPA: nucleotide exchange factor GrpE [Myxococcota bacterium]|nr:nucleotide exchange factor GrpE [Myxococcota bacterium]
MRTPAEEFALLREAVNDLRRLIEERGGEPGRGGESGRDAAIEHMGAELKAYRDDFVAQAEKPLLLDLLMLYDSFHWFHQSLVKQESSPEVVADAFQFLVDELLEILYRRDVVPITTGDRFDRTLHKAVQVMEAEQNADDNRVARVVKRGFLRKDLVLRPEEVVVYRFKGGGS